jgi:hypothetical protein
MADATHCRRPGTAEIMRRSGKAKPVAGVVQRADCLRGRSNPRTGLQNITFPSHADNFRHALLFHRAGPAPMISRPQRLRQTAADLEDKALQCEGIHCDDEQRSNGSPAPAVLTLAESEISQHHARSERNGDFTSPTSLVTRSKTLFGANSRLAAGQIPKCVGLDLLLRRIKSHCRRGWWRPVTGLLAHTEYGTVSTVFEPFRV